jgi:glutamyl-tRNA synthetase
MKITNKNSNKNCAEHSDVRVRFAPSPTGAMHIGGIRTALFNYFFAKKHKGTFILRIEDTDRNRFVPNAVDYLKDSLNWCGITYDEGPGIGGEYGPYFQSERKQLYQTYVNQLLQSGHAYYAFDTSEELESVRKKYEVEGKTFTYNWENRSDLKNQLSLNAADVETYLKEGLNYVVRFKMYDPAASQDKMIRTVDMIRGNSSFDRTLLDDKILMKSDGMPSYHLANIVDDHLMKISHVIRGEEWLPSLPLHIALYDSFDWKAPEFAHLPLILKPTGKGKLNKRDGDKMNFPVFPLAYTNQENSETSKGYREDGYLPDAVINFLALLGWNPGNEQEIFSKEELIQSFDIKNVNKSGARFDPEKAKWFNQHYIKQESNNELATLFYKDLEQRGIAINMEYVKEVVAIPLCSKSL